MKENYFELKWEMGSDEQGTVSNERADQFNLVQCSVANWRESSAHALTNPVICRSHKIGFSVSRLINKVVRDKEKEKKLGQFNLL